MPVPTREIELQVSTPELMRTRKVSLRPQMTAAAYPLAGMDVDSCCCCR